MADKLGRALLVAVLLAGAAVAGIVASFLLTPLLWSLEEPLGLELAGHSGPADWVILSFAALACAICITILGAVAVRLRRGPAHDRGPDPTGPDPG